MDKIPVYMLVTNDRYELPVAVEDTIYALARLVGVTESSVSKGVTRSEMGGKSKYHRVWIELTPEEAAEHAAIVNIARQKAGLA